MQFKKITFFAILSLIIFVGCDSKDNYGTNDEFKNAISKENQSINIELTTNAQQFLPVTISKNNVKIQGYEGKIVLLDFFATWCEPCKAEIPDLNNLRKTYSNDFEIIAVLLENNRSIEQVDAFKKEFNINYPISNTLSNFDLANAVGGVVSIPTMFLFDQQGNLVQKYVGMVPAEMLEIDIKKMLEKN
ncbi:MAG: TlpA family protein disulfide reductase [Candidatus Marinarcus sp.]|uniref:TlpA family protein disulfide reductase n=1 Tax=Candidatus Marinarcus sp. TaxID=3100987 RepID=UPI003AFFB75B